MPVSHDDNCPTVSCGWYYGVAVDRLSFIGIAACFTWTQSYASSAAFGNPCRRADVLRPELVGFGQRLVSPGPVGPAAALRRNVGTRCAKGGEATITETPTQGRPGLGSRPKFETCPRWGATIETARPGLPQRLTRRLSPANCCMSVFRRVPQGLARLCAHVAFLRFAQVRLGSECNPRRLCV
jgi:hypothetical protein